MRPLPLLVAVLLAGCAEGPFVETEISTTVEKVVDPLKRNAEVTVCYNADTPWQEIEALASETCATRGYQAMLKRTNKWQCRMTAPHRAIFKCYHPDMLNEDGEPIDPSSAKAVQEWRKRTGKEVPQRPRPLPDGSLPPTEAPAARVPAPAPAPAPAAAPAAVPAPAATPAPAAASPAAPAVRPLTPADIAGKPAVIPAPLTVPMGAPPPAPTTVPPTGGFTLEPGSWGQHFED